MIAAGTLAHMGLVGLGINWFIKQPDLDVVWTSLESLAKGTMPILATLCGMKAIATMNVVNPLVRPLLIPWATSVNRHR
jgi:hypothetical protein